VDPDGNVKWETQLSMRKLSEPVITADGSIHVVSAEGVLYRVHPGGIDDWKTWSAVTKSELAREVGRDGMRLAISDSGIIYVCLGGELCAVE